MSNFHQLQFYRATSGNIVLRFEDSIHGIDRTFDINPLNRAWESYYDEEGDHILVPVNIYDALLELLLDLQERE